MDESTASELVIRRFRDEAALPGSAVPVASLAVLWYIEPDGRDGYLAKFDGTQRVSTTVGDLMSILHSYLHSDADEETDG